MDDTPFLKVDLLNLKDSDIENLNKLRKENYDRDSLINYAEELVYTSTLNNTLKDLFKNPSDEFVRFLVKDFSETRITSNVIDRFRPIVKKAISNAVLDIVSKGFYHDEDKTLEEENTEIEEVNKEDSNNVQTNRKGIVTTEEELAAFDRVKKILEKNNKDISEVNYKDTTNYFSVYLKNTTRWIIRFNFDAAKKNVMTKLSIENAQKNCKEFEVDQAPRSMGESRVYINTIDDLYKFEEYIVDAYENVNQ